VTFLPGFVIKLSSESKNAMFYRVVMFLWGFVLDLTALMGMTDEEKDLEILLLRQQLRIVERKKTTRILIPRWQKVPLAVLAKKLKERTSNRGKS